MPSNPADGSGNPRNGAWHSFKDKLVKTWLANDLVAVLNGSQQGPIGVIIEANTAFPGGLASARWVIADNYRRFRRETPGDGQVTDVLAAQPVVPINEDVAEAWAPARFAAGDRLDLPGSLFTEAYLFGKLDRTTIEELVKDCGRVNMHPVHKIWFDHPIGTFVYKSARTIKCDAARIAFSTDGAGIVWAIADTGVQGTHPHFKRHCNLENLPNGIQHRDFTPDLGTPRNAAQLAADALTDAAGHGTHVAGIIAGQTEAGDRTAASWRVDRIVVAKQVRKGVNTQTSQREEALTEVSGLAPKCKLVSLKVLQKGADGVGAGQTSALLAAMGYLQQINGYGRDVKVHGLNLSLGYTFDPETFAAGQSPICVEVDRLVRCGVVVVVAAGNAGYGQVATWQMGTEQAAFGATIADPGNARLAITVGSTHRDQPHVYGVSYFSSKGPTADGRMKPDIVAPGEHIVSCDALTQPNGSQAMFREDTGTSMATPHVSGAIAGFLSVRQEFLGRPEEVKDIFVSAATDLKRRPEYQGSGLVDLMRALQSV